MEQLLIYLILLIVAAGIVYWLLNKIALPPPLVYVVWAVIAIVAIMLLFRLAGHGHVLAF